MIVQCNNRTKQTVSLKSGQQQYVVASGVQQLVIDQGEPRVRVVHRWWRSSSKLIAAGDRLDIQYRSWVAGLCIASFALAVLSAVAFFSGALPVSHGLALLPAVVWFGVAFWLRDHVYVLLRQVASQEGFVTVFYAPAEGAALTSRSKAVRIWINGQFVGTVPPATTAQIPLGGPSGRLRVGRLLDGGSVAVSVVAGAQLVVTKDVGLLRLRSLSVMLVLFLMFLKAWLPALVVGVFTLLISVWLQRYAFVVEEKEPAPT